MQLYPISIWNWGEITNFYLVGPMEFQIIDAEGRQIGSICIDKKYFVLLFCFKILYIVNTTVV